MPDDFIKNDAQLLGISSSVLSRYTCKEVAWRKKDERLLKGKYRTRHSAELCSDLGNLIFEYLKTRS